MTVKPLYDYSGRDNPFYKRGEDNIVTNIVTQRTKYGIKNGHLMVFSDDFCSVEKTLERTARGYRWNNQWGMVMGAFFHNVKFISEAEAIAYEKELRAARKKELADDK